MAQKSSQLLNDILTLLSIVQMAQKIGKNAVTPVEKLSIVQMAQKYEYPKRYHARMLSIVQMAQKQNTISNPTFIIVIHRVDGLEKG